MEPGLHETLVTARVVEQLQMLAEGSADGANVDSADQPHVLARHVGQLVERVLASEKNPGRRLQLVNDLVATLQEPAEQVLEPARQVLRVSAAAVPGAPMLEKVRPQTPLSDAALLTNARGEPSLGSELRAEIDTADEVDLLCAFVKWHGLRLLEPELRRLRQRRSPLRVITTTYMGATERIALDRLIREFGAEVKIQYDAQRTRLHAKAWLFRRRTRFDTAYVGSSNLSRAALLDGVEWNVRLSHVATPSLLVKFRATFDSYWNDESFETYNPEEDRDRLDDALAEASGRPQVDRVTISLAGLEVRPFPHQSTILEALETERLVHDRHRNLVVAATGTGKTVVAALDYRQMCDSATGAQPTLLFVAHRQEILHQSLRTYREVLTDASFGELYVGGARPERWHHVFASVQSLTAYGVERIPAHHFDIVVIDEFHHAEARTYRRILDHLRPRELLGLTATPERADGTDVRVFFEGRTAAELRLWDALGADLLCPFHYFAVSDGTDLSRVTWKRGRYDEGELSNLYTGNDVRAAQVLKELRDKVIDPSAMRALGFCVSVAHAAYMARVFNKAGIPALAVTGSTPAHERAEALKDLQSRQLNVLFAVDLFNEGLDLPDVDTVLFLRPTESSTIFIQQLGRGLRRTRDKAVLTALDFVGHHRKEFRFDHKLSALTGTTKDGLIKGLEQGFPFLPAGCQIVMEEQAQRVVLANLKAQLRQRWSHVVHTARQYGDMDLQTFLGESRIDLSDILRKGKHSWTQLRRDAGLPTPEPGTREKDLLKRVRAFAHVDDPVRARTYRTLLEGEVPYDQLSCWEQRLARMLVSSCWPDRGNFTSPGDGLTALRRETAFRDELQQVIDIAFDGARHLSVGLDRDLATLPLQVHATYSREEALEALDFQHAPNTMREGVRYIAEHNVDAFFITLKKSEADYSPTTLYRDYPISRHLFHWESQSTTSVNSLTGQRYISGSSQVLLFARLEQQGDFGTAPYLFLGPATYVSHEGERPIAITWRLQYALPAEFFAAASAVAI